MVGRLVRMDARLISNSKKTSNHSSWKCSIKLWLLAPVKNCEALDNKNKRLLEVLSSCPLPGSLCGSLSWSCFLVWKWWQAHNNADDSCPWKCKWIVSRRKQLMLAPWIARYASVGEPLPAFPILCGYVSISWLSPLNQISHIGACSLPQVQSLMHVHFIFSWESCIYFITDESFHIMLGYLSEPSV